MQDIERREDEPFLAAQQDLEQAYAEPGEQAPETYENQDQGQMGQQGETPDEIGRELEAEAEARRRELNQPGNELDPDADLEESIIYFSPVTRRYVIERAELV